MPLYEYECDACGQRFEVIQKKFSDASPETCGKCGKGPVRRLMSSPAIQFKGSGWYITDYAQKGKSDGGGSAGKSDTSDKADSKTDKKSDTEKTSDTEKKSDTGSGSTSSSTAKT